MNPIGCSHCTETGRQRHAHLDECQQCEAHPSDLCSTGRRLLAGFVSPIGKPGKPSKHVVIVADDDFVAPLPMERQ